ncbi:putative bifunctional diguanylate cyclase/phosphodiesterase [Rubrobacter indicoceani]|uniref:putative bifunctional diguanylate cyclase/phosphodiesterase n=1 Tax=Rubrobacter indicoceani TaxID=2051957 RepID=UPI000E5B0BEE|nr:bifunctional diguanylate cyclase/phosphodiesterase [Rubrobacter indicoceani]
MDVLSFSGFGFTLFFVAVYSVSRDPAYLQMAGSVMGFSVLIMLSRQYLKQGSVQKAVLITCGAILIISLIVLAISPIMFPAIAITPLVCVGVALPYANELPLKILIAAAWVATTIAAITGAWVFVRSPGNLFSLFDVAAVATTLAMAAALLLLLLWQFRGRILNSLSKARAAEARLRHEARYDSLTGLANRTLLSEKLSEIFALEAARAASRALLFLDVDRFKYVNDSLGHGMGDELLKVVAERLRWSLREADIIARMGGDEFVVVIEETSSGHAQRAARRVQEVLSTPMKVHGHELYVTVSTGVVEGLAGYDEPDDAIRDADIAMYRAKEQGKSRYVIFDEKMRHAAASLLKLENDLRRAVEQGEFVVHYQPVVWLASGSISGFEALVRWRHPERGLLYPDTFMKLAEETGMVHKIDRLVLGEACRKIARWREEYRDPFPPSISVNLSPAGLARPDLIREVSNVLMETRLPGHALIIELTESAVMEDAEASMTALHRLRQLGVRIHVDDFGTGYSSLQLLHRLPVDALKIDKSFVSGTGPEDPNGLSRGVMGENAEIVQTILTMAHALGMEVVGEGVETEEHLEVLREMGCDHVQGYHFSRPVTAERAVAILAAEPVW